MNKISRVSSYFLIAVLLLGVFFVATPKAVNAATTLELVNPLTGTNNFFFTTATKNVGDTFVINITVNGAVNVGTWQALITWDPTLLTFQSFVLPSDNILAYSSPISANTPGSGNLAAGATLGPGFTTGFTGSGTCGVVTLKIIQGVGLAPLPAVVSCALSFANLGTDTYLLDPTLASLAFTPVDGAYQLSWVAPSTIPHLYLSPTPIKPATNGTTFAVNVYVDSVDAGWEITGFQFSIMWNTTLIAPAAPFFTNGSFLETFQYAPSGVIYAMDLNTHDRVPPLAPIDPGYNYSIVGELLLPDFAPPYVGTYHPPFPSTASGPGLLGTFYFQAIYATVSPILALSSIDFIAEDVLVLNHNNLDIGFSSLTGAAYQAPQTVLGLAIDVYTQYSYPFGGQGGNQTSDSFGPQQQVDLYALVTYNDYPVQQKLVGYQIFHQPTGPYAPFNFTREGTTDVNGIAHVAFRLPWPCADPVGQIFGWWYVNATVEVAEQTVVDNLRFWVWWPVQVVSIEPKFTEIFQSKQPGQTMGFTITYLTYHMQPQQVLLTGTVYDELGYFVGADSFMTIVSCPVSNYPADLIPGNPTPAIYTHDFSIPLTTNAVVGKGIIYGNAFSDWPWNAGVPYCPEVTNTIDFYIKKPI